MCGFSASAGEPVDRGGPSVRRRRSEPPAVRAIAAQVRPRQHFLLIAGSYTPFAVVARRTERTILLSVAWGGALLGIAFRVLWTEAPRWLYTLVYIALGWAAMFFFPDFVANGSLTVIVLLAAGGLLYTIGGIWRANPFPSWFGFHEVFHSLTIVAFAAHYTGVSIATYALR
jgi:hemolysin III